MAYKVRKRDLKGKVESRYFQKLSKAKEYLWKLKDVQDAFVENTNTKRVLAYK